MRGKERGKLWEGRRKEIDSKRMVLNYIKRKGMFQTSAEEKEMIKEIRAVFKLKGTEKAIERVKAKIASLSILEEVISLYISEEELYPIEKTRHKEIMEYFEEEEKRKNG
jgi:hypothetical protein